MLYPLNDILLIGLIMSLGSVVQGALGFASGLLGVPLLVLSGFSLPEAATINLISTSLQNITGAWKLWAHLDPRELAVPVIIRILCIPVGTFCAWYVDEHLDPVLSKQLIGSILLVVVLLLWGCHIPPRQHLNFCWQGLAFSSSGFLLGFAAIGGAPLVLYVNALTWTAAKSRAFLFFCSAVSQPVAAWFFWSEFRWKIVPPALSTMIVLPLILAGLWIGFQAGHRLSKPFFRQITFGLVVLISLAAIASPWFDNS